MKPKPPVPVWRWVLWAFAFAGGILVFYVLLTPIWIGVRLLAWLAEFRARRRGQPMNVVSSGVSEPGSTR